MFSRRTMVAASLLLLGCGDPLVDADYLGEPLAVVRGSVLFTDEVDEDLPSGELRVALFWSASDVLQDEFLQAVDSVQQQVVTTSSFPASYEMSIFNAPPAALVQDFPGGDEPAAVGMVLLYVDVDGDRHWTENGFEPLVGGARHEVVLYAPNGLDGAVLSQPLAPGFHAVVPQRDALCVGDDEPHVPLDLAEPLWIDLVVGPPLDTLLYDLDCDSVIDEWCSLCPDPDELDAICQQDPEYCEEEIGHCFTCD